VCQSCFAGGRICSWDTPDGLTRNQHLKADFANVIRQLGDLIVLVNAMRDGTDEQSTMLLAKLRLGFTVETLAQSIRSRPDAAGKEGIRNDQANSRVV
jgi:hypothetical protein